MYDQGVFVWQSIYLQPMLQYTVLIAEIKFVGMKMMLECIIDKKGN